MNGVKYAQAVTSGTAAVHTAVGVIDPNPGDEIITTAVTDMGTIIGILYQNAVPIFADIDPRSGNLDIADVEAKDHPNGQRRSSLFTSLATPVRWRPTSSWRASMTSS